MRWMISAALGTSFVVQALAGVSTATAQAPAGAASKGGTSAINACSLLTVADIERVTGRPDRLKLPPQADQLPNGLTQCTWYDFTAALTPNMTPAWFDRNRQQEKAAKNSTVEPVSGIGDEAYFTVRSMRSESNVGIVVRAGTYQLAMGDLLPPDSVAWIKPKLVELAKLATAKLR